MLPSVDPLLRKYLWVFHLVFILLAVLIVARTVNLFVESAVMPAPSSRLPRVAASAPQEAVPTLNLEKLAKISGMPAPVGPALGGPDVAEPGTPGSLTDPNAAPVKSDLRVKLLGTLLAGTDEWSFASLQDLGTQRSQDYRVGDRVLGAEVLNIERQRVIVANNGRREYISNEDGPPPLKGPPVVEPKGSAIRATGENTYDVPRSEIDKALTDMNKLAMDARIVPAFKDGVSQGFKLFSIRPDSLYSKIGVVNGDIIKRINGFDMNSPEKALEVYSKLKESNRIDIELDRNGTNIRKQYSVTQ